jgi:predicted RNA-binding protein (TIGR00451 family)
MDFYQDEKLAGSVKKQILQIFKQVPEGEILFATDKRTEAFIVSPEMLKLKEQLTRDPYSLGIFAGELKDKKLLPSLQLLNNTEPREDIKVLVTNEAGQRFIYGKDIISKSVIWVSDKIMGKETVVVCDEDERPLGYAKALSNGRIMKKLGNDPILKNIQDIGWYIRGGR